MQKLFFPVALILSAVLIVLLQFGFIFMLLGLLPSLVAFYIDHDPTKASFKTVLASNFAAMLPSLTPMLQAGIHFKHYDVSAIVGDPGVWLLIYSGAAAGWCLIYLCRFIAHFLITLTYEYNILNLERQQKELAEEWGQQITGQPGA
ncbi:MAG: hypothetical protein KGJ06_04380 [Pseudomonadota bacterium]|nr:hypothetical protein [Pseudomonadota bacterium]